MNIITSSDSGLLPYIPIQLQSIADTIKNQHVNFFLLHDGVGGSEISKFERQCTEYRNISFYNIEIRDDRYKKLAKLWGGWSSPAYYPLFAHMFLPEGIDRALYIDAGDTLFVGDPTDYYETDFNGNALIVTPALYKSVEGEIVLYEEKDLGNVQNLKGIVRGLFNSGSYVINLNHMRNLGYTVDDYIGFAEALSKAVSTDNGGAYWGNQGLLSAMFVGSLQGYNYPDVKNILYMPNNFCMWFFDFTNDKPWYSPNIIHFAGSEKPWRMKYPISLKMIGDKQNNESISMDSLKIGQAEYYYIWHETAIKTQNLLDNLGVNW